MNVTVTTILLAATLTVLTNCGNKNDFGTARTVQATSPSKSLVSATAVSSDPLPQFNCKITTKNSGISADVHEDIIVPLDQQYFDYTMTIPGNNGFDGIRGLIFKIHTASNGSSSSTISLIVLDPSSQQPLVNQALAYLQSMVYLRNDARNFEFLCMPVPTKQ